MRRWASDGETTSAPRRARASTCVTLGMDLGLCKTGALALTAVLRRGMLALELVTVAASGRHAGALRSGGTTARWRGRDDADGCEREAQTATLRALRCLVCGRVGGVVVFVPAWGLPHRRFRVGVIEGLPGAGVGGRVTPVGSAVCWLRGHWRLHWRKPSAPTTRRWGRREQACTGVNIWRWRLRGISRWYDPRGYYSRIIKPPFTDHVRQISAKWLPPGHQEELVLSLLS
jgi:hypothetical protein